MLEIYWLIHAIPPIIISGKLCVSYEEPVYYASNLVIVSRAAKKMIYAK